MLPAAVAVLAAHGGGCVHQPRRVRLHSHAPRAPDTRTELVGGSEAYLPACRHCYNALHAVRASDAVQPQVAR
jgi:thymidine kinase